MDEQPKTPDAGDGTTLARNELMLVRVGPELRLRGSPLKEDYEASYPNPDGVDRLVVAFGPTGTARSRCEVVSRPVGCTSTPFLTNTRLTSATGTLVRVWDIYGQPIAAFNFLNGHLVDDTTAPPAATSPSPGSTSDPRDDTSNGDGNPSEPPGTPAGQDAPEGDGTEGKPTDPADSDPGDETPPDGSSDDVDPCSTEAVRQAFCTQLNANLDARGSDYRYDCSRLDSDDWQDSVPGGGLGGGWTGGVQGDGETAPACGEIVPTDYEGACTDWSIGLHFTNWGSVVTMQLLMDGVCTKSPLLLDLDGDGIHLSSWKEGVFFDLGASGQLVRTAWPEGKDAFLALDRNGNGVIDDGSELFGNVTARADHADGFAALRTLDSNGDGRVDQKDREFSRLLLWVDATRDGKSTPDELASIEGSDIVALGARPVRRPLKDSFDAHGNSIPLTSSFVRADGRTGAMVDAFFRYGLLPQAAVAAVAAHMPGVESQALPLH